RWPSPWLRSATWRAGSRQIVPVRLQRRQPKTRPKGNGLVNEITTTGDKKLVLVSGRANPELAEQVAENLGTELLPTDIYNFANGEIYVRYSESVRGSDVFVLQSHCAPINEWLMEQLIMVDALKRASAKRITVIAPFFPYARQDKKHRGREPIPARPVAHRPTVPPPPTPAPRAHGRPSNSADAGPSPPASPPSCTRPPVPTGSSPSTSPPRRSRDTSTVRSTTSSRCRSSPATSRTSIPAISPWSLPMPAASRSPRTGRIRWAESRWPSSTRPATSPGPMRARPTASSVRSRAGPVCSSTT